MAYSKNKFIYQLQQIILFLVLGKVEGRGELLHGHVSAVTVAPEFRRLGLARKLMNYLEEVSDKMFT